MFTELDSRDVNEPLVALIRDEEFIRSLAPEDVARIVERRWASYDRRHPKTPSGEDRVRDLAKGLRDHFETDPSLGAEASFVSTSTSRSAPHLCSKPPNPHLGDRSPPAVPVSS
jgi:hypothetical protein